MSGLVKNRRSLFAALLLAAGTLGCADEDPTQLAGPLLPGGEVRTEEIILEFQQFADDDTTAGGYTRPSQSDTLVVANDYRGILDANALLRFVRAPATVLFRVGDSLRVDSMPAYIGARMVLRVDTLRLAGERPIRFAVYRTAESWDPATATWTLRVDSLGARAPWAQPGGTRGELVDTASLVAGADSVSFNVDSATIAAWSDTTSIARGAIVVAETPDTRVRVSSPVLRLRARPALRPDTVVDAVSGAIGRTYVYDPPQPVPGGTLRVGGNPAWRSFVRLREGLGSQYVTGCAVQRAPQNCDRLRDVTINYAALVVHPSPVPTAFVPEDSMRIDARAVFESAFVPLTRAPLSAVLGRSQAIPPLAFTNGEGAYEVPITSFLADLVRARADTASAPVRAIALLAVSEGSRLGFAEFGSTQGQRLTLRIIYTRIEADNARFGTEE